MPRSELSSLRNRLAHWICNWALEHVATRDYADMIGGSIRYGLNSAARDSEEGLEPAPDWRQRLRDRGASDELLDAAERGMRRRAR